MTKPWIVSIYDASGNALRPWAEAGFPCIAMDRLNRNNIELTDRAFIYYAHLDIPQIGGAESIIADLTLLTRAHKRIALVMGWPPCDDLAVSGARHFMKKAAANPAFQDNAVSAAKHAMEVASHFNSSWLTENPVSVLASKWRKPDVYFHPWEFGGYLPEDDVHPLYPEYIKPRDAYPKKTGIWHSKDFIFPEKKPVLCDPGYSSQFKKLGGKSAKTKAIRSAGPRGFLRAVFEANHKEKSPPR